MEIFSGEQNLVVAITVNLSAISSRCLDIINSYELKQFNTLPTCHDATLDLFITNENDVSVQSATKATTFSNVSDSVHKK